MPAAAADKRRGLRAALRPMRGTTVVTGLPRAIPPLVGRLRLPGYLCFRGPIAARSSRIVRPFANGAHSPTRSVTRTPTGMPGAPTFQPHALLVAACNPLGAGGRGSLFG